VPLEFARTVNREAETHSGMAWGVSRLQPTEPPPVATALRSMITAQFAPESTTRAFVPASYEVGFFYAVNEPAKIG